MTSGGYTNGIARYHLLLSFFYGVPSYRNQAAQAGEVRMLLPRGSYRLVPSITSAGSATGGTGGTPFDISVGAGDRFCVSPCLQVDFAAPPCTNTPNIVIRGQVRSTGNHVAKITYSLNGGAPLDHCNDCGPDPSFDIPIVLAGAGCADNTLTVTAISAECGESFVTKTIRLDTTPPEMHCPADIVTPCLNANETPITFPVTATDNCGGSVTVVCTPPAGSWFPAGTTPVTCSAEDACGNRSTCAFNVTVQTDNLSIERAVIVRWDCGVLQCADNASGPWTDIPGASNPYWAMPPTK